MEKENQLSNGFNHDSENVCANAIAKLSEFWGCITYSPENEDAEVGINKFLDDVDYISHNNKYSGEQIESHICDLMNNKKPVSLIFFMLVCFAYARQGIDAKREGCLPHAWYYTSKCQYWLGALWGAWAIDKDQDNSIKELSKKALDARHAENRAMKKEVHAWLDENMSKFNSMDSAAESIAGDVAPIKWRTARDWIGEWKKLRSAGTP